MIIIKNNYYIYIENINDLKFEALKANKKINIIFRNHKNYKLKKILTFRKSCKLKRFKFFIANQHRLAHICKADGLYISAYNKKRYFTKILKIGSAHNVREINEKINQNCKTIIVSRLFKTIYHNKKTYLGVCKFNLLNLKFKSNLVPLGGINYRNLLKLNIIKSEGFGILSVIKKKPAFLSRLF